MLLLLFPLASTFASVGDVPGEVTQTFIHKESEALITRPWLLYLPIYSEDWPWKYQEISGDHLMQNISLLTTVT